jgi:hypothetical protein
MSAHGTVAQLPLLAGLLLMHGTQAKVLPGLDQGVEVVKGDVFKFQTLPPAIDNW